jgi:hypothetical protein
MKTIDRTTYECKQSQSVYHTLMCCLDTGRKAKVHVCRNLYDFQSYVTGDLWSESEGWVRVFIHPIHLYPGLSELKYCGGVTNSTAVVMALIESRALDVLKEFDA